ncbi:hypothetical protein C900_05653 [Fulvivirga imtechensis AK7]|uniref:NAD(P)-binding domain-containing protein n=1 Tax=Fulvivirga imtechensis AK7 TaxID=1237149 RepID=L8JJI3_9BACT|nr:NAD(P)-binding oxidoreductase [Fulvivirga imtechensis]ELR68960.1 hypothetical protein C900_05653 [Fulvivirga imtechensis AK7]
MTTLVIGASGATGRQLVEQLVNMGQKVKIIVRLPEALPRSWIDNNSISIIAAAVPDITIDEMTDHVKGCHAVASCLGHNLTLKGIFGKPKELVTDSVRLLCNAIKNSSPKYPVKFVLMNTVGHRNRDLNETSSFAERMVIGVLRLLLPPQSDNEKAADYLRVTIGQNDPLVAWVVVRPDSLLNEDKVTGYNLHVSPVRSPIFNPGKTSRINVGHFMARLIVDDYLWKKWKGQMPVIYNVRNKNG